MRETSRHKRSSPCGPGGAAGLVLAFALGSLGARPPGPDMWPGVPEDIAPLEVVRIPGEDGYEIPAVVRRPPGEDIKPVVIFLHGGWAIWPAKRLEAAADRPLVSFFLAGGYVTVVPTTRRFQEDPDSDLPWKDGLAIVEYARRMEGIDPGSIVVYGESGGGSFALELARRSDDVAAVGVHEPASLIFAGLLSREAGDGTETGRPASIIQKPEEYYTEQVSRSTLRMIGEIRCPLYVQSGAHPIRELHHRFFFPDLMSASRHRVVISHFPEMPHPLLERGGARWSRPTFEGLNHFFQDFLRVEPRPVERRLIEWRSELKNVAEPMTLERYLRRRNQ